MERSAGLFAGYLDPRRPYAGAYDEMFAADGTPRSAYRRLITSCDHPADDHHTGRPSGGRGAVAVPTASWART